MKAVAFHWQSFKTWCWEQKDWFTDLEGSQKEERNEPVKNNLSSLHWLSLEDWEEGPGTKKHLHYLAFKLHTFSGDFPDFHTSHETPFLVCLILP